MGTENDDFFKNVSGVIHVGANTGQERWFYKQNGVATVWIEPIPDVFKTLETNLESFKHLKPYFAYNYLVTDVDDKEYVFHVTSNYGESSSIFDLNLHKEIWPDVVHHHNKHLKSITLTTLIEKENIDHIFKGKEQINNYISNEIGALKSKETIEQKDAIWTLKEINKGFLEYTTIAEKKLNNAHDYS